MPDYKLRHRSEFKNCYDNGKRLFSASFVIFALKQAEPVTHWRLGMAVSKKTGCAVWRNRVRRLVRECFRLAQHQVVSGFDLVIVPKRGLNPRSLDLAKVQEELLPLIERLAKLHKS